MKKLVFIAFAFVAIAFANCGNKAENIVDVEDTVTVDTTLVDTTAVDTVVAE